MANQFRGTWAPNTAYAVNDIANYQGSAYLCSAPSNTTFFNSDAAWSVFAGQGQPGSGQLLQAGNSSFGITTDGYLNSIGTALTVSATPGAGVLTPHPTNLGAGVLCTLSTGSHGAVGSATLTPDGVGPFAAGIMLSIQFVKQAGSAPYQYIPQVYVDRNDTGAVPNPPLVTPEAVNVSVNGFSIYLASPPQASQAFTLAWFVVGNG